MVLKPKPKTITGPKTDAHTPEEPSQKGKNLNTRNQKKTVNPESDAPKCRAQPYVSTVCSAQVNMAPKPKLKKIKVPKTDAQKPEETR